MQAVIVKVEASLTKKKNAQLSMKLMWFSHFHFFQIFHFPYQA